jgi:hypothetical protein
VPALARPSARAVRRFFLLGFDFDSVGPGLDLRECRSVLVSAPEFRFAEIHAGARIRVAHCAVFVLSLRDAGCQPICCYPNSRVLWFGLLQAEVGVILELSDQKT